MCSDIGVDMMKLGGNAVDSAIATTFCIGVVNCFSSGIGGGGFMTVRVPKDNGSEVVTIDFRETAPAASNTTMYTHDPMSARIGGLSVGVPGEIRGLLEAHRRWGSLPWKELVLPAAEVARGWKVHVELQRRIEMFSELMLGNPDWSEVFAPEGRLLREGDLITRTAYAQTLDIIAEDPDAFYKGSIADAIIKKINSTGGIMTHDDLKKYAVNVSAAEKGTYMGKTVYTTHAPTSGPVLLHMLNLIEHYDLSKGVTTLNVHRFIEAMKFGFAARTRLGDPTFMKDTTKILEIPTKSYASRIQPNITDDRTHKSGYYHPEFDVPEDHGTSHTSVVDSNGMAVAITSTVNLVFGSQVLDPVTGIILNDEMDDFSIPGVPNTFGLWPSPYNYPIPGKRPLSSTAPTIVEHEDGTFALAIGASGGSLIFGAMFQVMMNLWHVTGSDASSAIEAGRVHDQLYPAITIVDNLLPQSLADSLVKKGHNVTVMDINRVAAAVQLVESRNGFFYAASDSRKNGIAAGY